MFTSGSPNSGMLEIGISLVLQDRFSNQAREASSQIRRLHQEAKNITNANLNALRTVSTMGAGIGTAMLAGFGNAITTGADFVRTMTLVDGIATKNGVTFDQLSDKAQSLGRDTMFTSQQIASAMQYFAMSGMGTQEIFNSITAAANLAGATLTEIGGKGGTADILTNIMKMFRIEFTPENTTRVTDVLVKGVTKSNTSLTDLAEAIKYAGTTVTNLGASIEQTTAFIGVLGDAGIQGSMAGTAMANTYRYLTKSIEDTRFKGSKALASLGLGKQDFVDAKGNLIDIGAAMQKISKALVGKSDTERFNTLVSILGVRGERGGSVMVKAFEDYGKLLDQVQNSQGTAATLMEKQMSSIAGGIDKMVSSLENIKTTYTEAIAPVLNPIFNTVAAIFDVIRKILATPVLGTFIASFVTFGTLLVTIRLGVLALGSGFKLLFNDSTVSFRNMMLVWKQQWAQVFMSAERYQMLQAAIIAQQKAGIVSNATGQTVAMYAGAQAGAGAAMGTMMAKGRSEVRNGVFFSNGRWYQQTGRGATGVSRISQRAAEGILGGAAMGSMMKMAGMGVAKKGVGALLGRLLGFIGGPWGIAIGLIASFLPSIISALTGSKNSTEENTAALMRNNEILDPQSQEEKVRRGIYKGSDIRGADKLTNEEQLLVLTDAINRLVNTMGQGKSMNVNMHINGNPVGTGVIDFDTPNQEIELGTK